MGSPAFIMAEMRSVEDAQKITSKCYLLNKGTKMHINRDYCKIMKEKRRILFKLKVEVTNGSLLVNKKIFNFNYNMELMYNDEEAVNVLCTIYNNYFSKLFRFWR